MVLAFVGFLVIAVLLCTSTILYASSMKAEASPLPGRIRRPAISLLPYSPLPEDATILKTESLPDNRDYMPEVGNGHVAAVIKGKDICMNGLYNGYNITSHRARIPSSISYDINATSPPSPEQLYTLDIARGIFTETHTAPGVNISLRTYAHRSLDHVLVVELELSRDDVSTLVDVTLSLNPGPRSRDIDLVSTTAGIQHWRTKEAEYAELAPRTDFYIKESRYLEGKISMSPGLKEESFLALTVIGVDEQKVASQFDQAQTLFHNGTLLSSHVREWIQIWNQGRIDVKGDVTVARLNYASLYYILSALPFKESDPAWPFFGVSPGGLAHGSKDRDYNGHVFWDQGTWIFPGIALLHPDLGLRMAESRTRTLNAAKILAKETGFDGARYPWESAFTGLETCPAKPYGEFEIHINGDVSMMVRQYWQLTGDIDFLKNKSGGEIIKQTARFWVSRTTYQAEDDTYRLLGVMPPDEYHFPVNDSAYTNNIAVLNLNFANEVARILGEPLNSTWSEVAQKMYLPYDSTRDYHPEYDGYILHETTKQADVVLLNFPLMVNMQISTMKNDLLFYEESTPKFNAPAMTWGMFLLGWLQLGNEAKAAELFNRTSLNAQEPFLIWTETALGVGAVNFLTGMGGYLQAILFGYGGCRIHDNRLAFDPKLIPGTTEVTFTGLNYMGCSFNLIYEDSTLTLTLTSQGDKGLEVNFEKIGTWEKLEVGKSIDTQRQSFSIRTTNNVDVHIG